MITEIEMRYAEKDEDGGTLSGLVTFYPPSNMFTINDIESQGSVSMAAHQAQDLAARINKMLEIVGGPL